MPRFRILVALATLVPLSFVHAGQTCVTSSVPLTLTNWNQTVSIPRFDSSLGVLTAVHVQLGAHLEGSAGVENPSFFGEVVPMQFAVQTSITRPDNTLILVATPSQNFAPHLSGYDGTVDFGGSSGAFFPNLSVDVIPSPTVTLSAPLDLALFSGPTSNPGTIALNVASIGTSTATGSGPIITTFLSRSSAQITVCYDYEPAVVSYCAGTASTCPCANGSFFGEGCKHSQNIGSYLSNTGAASIGADTFVLTASSLPTGTSALCFQGTTRIAGGSGSIFGDGLLCVGGTVTRLGIGTAPAGIVSYPAVGDPLLSIAGLVAAGDVRMYQVWYRDALVHCTSDTFNTTQALEVHWVQ